MDCPNDEAWYVLEDEDQVEEGTCQGQMKWDQKKGTWTCPVCDTVTVVGKGQMKITQYTSRMGRIRVRILKGWIWFKSLF